MTCTLVVLAGCCLKPGKKTQMTTLLNMMVSVFNVYFEYMGSDVLLLCGKYLSFMLCAHCAVLTSKTYLKAEACYLLLL